MAYEGLLRVGLLVRGPGVPKGKVVTEPVSTIDLPATFADYAGVSLAGRAPQPQPQAADREATRPRLRLLRMGPARLALRRRPVARHGAHGDSQAHLETNSGAGELYDLKNDPKEMDNRFGDPGVEKIQRELMDMIRSRPKDKVDPLPQVGMA